jgi:Fur family ferric uptake transcriptional regulator
MRTVLASHRSDLSPVCIVHEHASAVMTDDASPEHMNSSEPQHAEPSETPQLQAFAPLCSVFRRFLKSRDLKYTQERADVLDAIITRDGSFEAEELLFDLRARGHDVSKATIYRTIRLLLDAGIITQSLFDAKQSHYELIYGREPRDCMVCMKTGRRIEFSSRELTALRDRICRELGWQPVGHRFQIFAVSPRPDESQVDSSERA